MTSAGLSQLDRPDSTPRRASRPAALRVPARHVPVSWPEILAGAFLAFMASVHKSSLSLFLASPETGRATYPDVGHARSGACAAHRRGFPDTRPAGAAGRQREEPHTMSSPYPRDLIGYAGKPPNPKWPGDARLAINFVMNYEEGSEYSVPDGDGFSEATLTEAGGSAARRHRARPGRRGHVRVRQPRRLLARDAELRGARPAPHRVRLRARPGAQSPRRGRHPRRRLRRVLARLAMGQALRAVRGGGARAHPPRGGVDRSRLPASGRWAGTAATGRA